MKKKKQKKWKNFFIFTLLLISVLSIIFFSYKGLNWYFSSKATRNTIKDINKVVKIKEQTELEKAKKQENPYWDYTKMNLIEVDFNELKKKNNETVGWIQIPNTNINYPFVQAKNNTYYLTHSYNKTKNSAGWIFLDYKNNIENFDKNTIIYAHDRKDKTMFGTLKNTLKKNWLKEEENFYIKISTEYENTLWYVFSIYHIPTTTDYLQTKFKKSEDFLDFANRLIKRSEYNFNSSIKEEDKILTLSTCYNKKEKLVLHAKLIKQQKRKNK